MKRRNQNQKFSFPFFAGSPHTPRRKRNCKEKFLVLVHATGGSVRGAHCSLHHTIGAYGEVSSHHTLGACVSPFQDFARNAFGFHRTEGASQYEAQNSARAKRECVWREWQNPKNSKGFPTIFSERIAEPFARGGGSMFSEHSTQNRCEPIFFLLLRKREAIILSPKEI